MNLKSKINKLQMALQLSGRVMLITRRQNYLPDKDAICTKYEVRTPRTVIDAHTGQPKKKNVLVFDTYSQIDLLQWLAAAYKAVRDG